MPRLHPFLPSIAPVGSASLSDTDHHLSAVVRASARQPLGATLVFCTEALLRGDPRNKAHSHPIGDKIPKRLSHYTGYTRSPIPLPPLRCKEATVLSQARPAHSSRTQALGVGVGESELLAVLSWTSSLCLYLFVYKVGGNSTKALWRIK